MLLLSDFFFFKQNTAYGMHISDWSSDVCSSDLVGRRALEERPRRIFDRALIRNSRAIVEDLRAGTIGEGAIIFQREIGAERQFAGVLIAIEIGKEATQHEAGASRTGDAIGGALVEIAHPDADDITTVIADGPCVSIVGGRSEEHTSELPSLMRISYAVF